MSWVLGVFATQRAQLPDDRVLRSMIRAMESRGDEQMEVHREANAFLAVGRYSWETADHLAGPVFIARRGSVVVAADASIYYRNELRQELAGAGVRAASDSPADLILAAYEAWGGDCAKHLEGDFAFAVFDLQHRTALAFRDFVGRRPLCWTEVNGALVVASTVGAVIEYPEVSRELDVEAIARELSALTSRGDETCYKSVSKLPAGWMIERAGGGRPRARRFWEPPEIRSFARNDPRAAEEELRALIGRATLERMAPTGSTALSMSGGRDSPAIYGAGRHALAKEGGARTLDAVSVSFPPGDPGREDEYIESIVGRWGEKPRWVDIQPLTGRTDLFFEAASRDASMMFPFEGMNRACAREARRLGTRVMLDGHGGDQLFGASARYHADLLRTGRWRTLAAEWRSEGFRGGREFFRRVVRPNLSTGMLRAATALRKGRPLAEPMDFTRKPVRWLSRTFIREHGVREFERDVQIPTDGLDLAAHELYWHLMTPDFPNFAVLVSAAMLDEGLELRSPLFDERIVRFMAGQPVRERHSMREHKWLLRRAMRGLIPDDVLASRTRRTGKPDSYIAALVKALLGGLMKDAVERPLLAELGIVDADVLHESAAMILAGPRFTGLEIQMYFTLYAEQWLRTHATGEGMKPFAETAAVATA